MLLNKITKYEINIKSFKRIKSIKINLENWKVCEGVFLELKKNQKTNGFFQKEFWTLV